MRNKAANRNISNLQHKMGLKGITFESTDDTIMFKVPLLLL